MLFLPLRTKITKKAFMIYVPSILYLAAVRGYDIYRRRRRFLRVRRVTGLRYHLNSNELYTASKEFNCLKIAVQSSRIPFRCQIHTYNLVLCWILNETIRCLDNDLIIFIGCGITYFYIIASRHLGLLTKE